MLQVWRLKQEQQLGLSSRLVRFELWGSNALLALRSAGLGLGTQGIAAARKPKAPSTRVAYTWQLK